jgi:hypothetical protein
MNEQQDHDLAIERPQGGLQTRSTFEAVARVRYELEAMMIYASQNPRDEEVALAKIARAAKRPGFAENATYEYKRGGNNISGPSVYLARPLAVYWKNLDYGCRVVDEGDDHVHLQGYCFDLEARVRSVAEDSFAKLVQRKGRGWVAPDERDLRELVNKRRALLIRNCILEIIPQDIQDRALDYCSQTLLLASEGKLTKNREDTIRALVVTFDEFSVSKEMLERYLGHSIATVSAEELVKFQGIYRALRDGQAKVADHFDSAPAAANVSAKKDLADLVPKSAPAATDSAVANAKPATLIDDEPDAAAPAEIWHREIRIEISEPPESWLDSPIASKGPLAGVTLRQAPHVADSAQRARLDELLRQGAEQQRDKGVAEKRLQLLAAAFRFAAQNGGAKQ